MNNEYANRSEEVCKFPCMSARIFPAGLWTNRWDGRRAIILLHYQSRADQGRGIRWCTCRTTLMTTSGGTRLFLESVSRSRPPEHANASRSIPQHERLEVPDEKAEHRHSAPRIGTWHRTFRRSCVSFPQCFRESNSCLSIVLNKCCQKDCPRRVAASLFLEVIITLVSREDGEALIDKVDCFSDHTRRQREEH